MMTMFAKYQTNLFSVQKRTAIWFVSFKLAVYKQSKKIISINRNHVVERSCRVHVLYSTTICYTGVKQQLPVHKHASKASS